MLYFDKYSERLFFTTTMQNAVQSYSLRNGRLLDPAPTHPSPPTVFAVSPTFDILLSSSANPPTTYLTNIVLNRLPMLLQPDCSTSAVVAASFHPEQGNMFALGFADGTVATFDATLFREEQNLEKRTLYPGKRGQIAHIARLHSPVSHLSYSARSSMTSLPSLASDPTKSAIPSGDYRSGIKVVAFVPKLACTTVSVGSDGLCCIVQFQRSGFHGTSQIIRSWSVSAPATSLSIVCPITSLDAAQVDGAREKNRWDSVTQSLVLAIGRDDGRVHLYGFDGNLLAMRDFNDGGRVLDLEWLDGPGDNPSMADTIPNNNASQPELASPQTQTSSYALQDRPISPPKIRVKLHVKNSAATGGTDSQYRSTTQNAQVQNTLTNAPTNVSSRGSSKASKKRPHKKKAYVVRASRRASSASAASHSTNASSRWRAGSGRPPSIPPRPVPRPGGKLDLRRQETSNLRGIAAQQETQTMNRSFAHADASELGIPAHEEALTASSTQQTYYTPSSVYNSTEDLPRPSRRSLSPEQLRTAVSNDLNALTGSDLKPVPSPTVRHPTNIGTTQDGSPDRVSGQYTIGPLSQARPIDTQSKELAPGSSSTANALPPITEPPTDKQLRREPSQLGQLPIIRAPQMRPSLKPVRAYVSKSPGGIRKATPAARQSVNSQSTTSTGTIIDWDYHHPFRRGRAFPEQTHKYTSKPSQGVTNESPAKKDSGASGNTVLEWHPHTNAALTRSLFGKNEVAAIDHAVPTAVGLQFNPPNTPPQVVVSGASSPPISPKSELRPRPATAGFPFISRREKPLEQEIYTHPRPSTAAPSAERPAEGLTQKKQEDFKPSPIPAFAPASPGLPTIPVTVLSLATPTPLRRIPTQSPLPPQQPPPDIPKPPVFPPSTASPDHLSFTAPSTRSHRASSSVNWPASLYGRMNSSEAAAAAEVGHDPSLFTLEETIRVECLEVREQMHYGFEEQRRWIEQVLREQNLGVARLVEENGRLREEIGRLITASARGGF